MLLTLDGDVVAQETFEGTILPGESVTYTFDQTLDLSIEGQLYLIEATTVFADDEFQSNDSFSKEVLHLLGNDIGVAQIITPATEGDFSDAEEVTVTVTNFGGLDQSNFEISMDLDGTIVTETITATLAPLESLEYTFIETIDLSILQDYTLTVSTLLAGDQNTSNDSITITINSLICQPTGNCEDFNDGVIQIALADQNISVQCDGTSTGYSDNTDIEFGFILDDNPFEGSLQVGFGNSNYALWIDFNDNNDFEENELLSTELVPSGNTDFEFTINFNNFPNVTQGEHLMRLRGGDLAFGGNTIEDLLDPCAPLGFGRTNDFTANISGVLSIGEQQINDGELIVTSLEDNNFDIRLNTEFNERIFIAVFNISGQQLTYKPVAQVNGGGYRINLDMSAMSSGVYLLRLGSSNPETFKTAKIIVE